MENSNRVEVTTKQEIGQKTSLKKRLKKVYKKKKV